MKKFLYLLAALVIIAIGVVIGILVFKETNISNFVVNRKNHQLSADVVATVGDQKITKTELNVYYQSVKTQVENIYTDKVWNIEVLEDGTNYGQAIKDSTLDKLIFIKLVCSKAGEYGVALTPDDNIRVEGYVNAFFESVTEETASKYNLTKEVVTGIYRDNVLCRKVYDKITLNAETDASVETCKQADLIKIKLNKYYVTSDNEKKFLSEEEIAQLKLSAQDYLKEMSAEDFFVLAKRVSADNNPRVTCGKKDLDQAYNEKVFALKTGETSQLIETDEAFFIYYCENEYNEDMTKKVITEKTESDRKNYFTGLYTKWKDSTEIVIADDALESLK